MLELPTYTPKHWFWVVNGDESRAWSSAVSAYVTQWDANRTTRIDSETSLSNVLRGHGLYGPAPSADDVRAEAQRRIMALVGAATIEACLIKQLNANMRANELNDYRHNRELTTQEAGEAAALRGLADQIKAIRAASNILEPNPPTNFTADEYWP
jgi:hypothetical protein